MYARNAWLPRVGLLAWLVVGKKVEVDNLVGVRERSLSGSA